MDVRDLIALLWTSISLMMFSASFALPFLAWEEYRINRRELAVLPSQMLAGRLIAEQNVFVSLRLLVIDLAFIFLNMLFAAAGLIAVLLDPGTGPEAQQRSLLIPIILIGGLLVLGGIQYFIMMITFSMRNARLAWHRLQRLEKESKQ